MDEIRGARTAKKPTQAGLGGRPRAPSARRRLGCTLLFSARLHCPSVCPEQSNGRTTGTLGGCLDKKTGPSRPPGLVVAGTLVPERPGVRGGRLRASGRRLGLPVVRFSLIPAQVFSLGSQLPRKRTRVIISIFSPPFFSSFLLLLLFFFFSFFFRATPVACANSQAMGRIRAASVTFTAAHSKAGSLTH